MIITRDLQPLIEKRLFQKKVIILYGARQVGKTTLAQTILKKHQSSDGYLNCEIIGVAQALAKQDPHELRKVIGNSRIVVLDEAQRVTNIGLALKLLIDTYPNIQIIATGSSSFDLANTVNEPLTGRSLEFIVYPFSLSELSQVYKSYELDSQLERCLRFGLYPEVVGKSEPDAHVFLDDLTGKYLYKDILSFEGLKRSDLVVKLLQLLAFQVGQEVSLHELAVNLSCNRNTVAHYLDILEKAFVIFSLRSLSRNLRKELMKKHKYYFYDVGIRNSIISQYNLVSQRNDVGSLWENFCLVERQKYLQRMEISSNQYFWRTHDQQEIDYVEERDGRLFGYEFKWGDKRLRKPKAFLEAYPNSDVELVNQRNYHGFIGLP